MESIRLIWEYIGRTNLFNFIIFLYVFILIWKMANLGDMLERAKQSVIDHIEESKSKKADSEDHLKQIEETVSHLGEEIEGLIKKSEDNAKLVGEKILQDAGNMAEGIRDNARKVVENKSALLKNDILRRASQASIDVARKHIINELRDNDGLHQKLIDESIEAINGIEG